MVSGCKELILWGAGSFQDVMEEDEEDSEEIMAEVVDINPDQIQLINPILPPDDD